MELNWVSHGDGPQVMIVEAYEAQARIGLHSYRCDAILECKLKGTAVWQSASTVTIVTPLFRCADMKNVILIVPSTQFSAQVHRHADLPV